MDPEPLHHSTINAQGVIVYVDVVLDAQLFDAVGGGKDLVVRVLEQQRAWQLEGIVAVGAQCLEEVGGVGYDEHEGVTVGG